LELWQRWTPRKIETLKRCPFAFKLAYIEEKEPPRLGRRIYESCLRRFLRDFLKYDSLDSYLETFRQDFLKLSEQTGLIVSAEKEEILISAELLEGQKVLSHFWEENISFRKNGDTELELERWISFSYNNLHLSVGIDRIQKSKLGPKIINYEPFGYRPSSLERHCHTQTVLSQLAYQSVYKIIPPAEIWSLTSEGVKIIRMSTSEASAQQFLKMISQLSTYVKLNLALNDGGCLLAQGENLILCPFYDADKEGGFYKKFDSYCDECEYLSLCLQDMT